MLSYPSDIAAGTSGDIAWRNRMAGLRVDYHRERSGDLAFAGFGVFSEAVPDIQVLNIELGGSAVFHDYVAMDVRHVELRTPGGFGIRRMPGRRSGDRVLEGSRAAGLSVKDWHADDGSP